LSSGRAGLSLVPLEGGPLREGPERLRAFLDLCDGSAPHRPWRPCEEGIGKAAEETSRVVFPRRETARLLLRFQEELGAPEPALQGAALLEEPRTLVVLAGQQPLPFGGPLFVLYKVWTLLALARKARELLGRPVVPLFWNASEDHDLEEIGRVGFPGPRGERVLFRAPLEAWAGRPAYSIPPDRVWREAVLAFLAERPEPAGEGSPAAELLPREEEGWSRWISRLLSRLFGGAGLVVLEPHGLRSLGAPLFRRVLEEWREAAELLEEGWKEKRASLGGKGERAFPPLEGPPLFLEEEGFRRRILAREGRFVLKGSDRTFSREALLARLEERPGDFSPHGSLRPILQNLLFPVFAQVVGPGEASYLGELFSFHLSPLGAGRRMPLLWPRLSATLLDEESRKTLSRFGLEVEDLFLEGRELGKRGLPGGRGAAALEGLKARFLEELRRIGGEGIRLEPTLEAPFRKTGDQAARLLDRLAARTAAAEARARGFAPSRLERLSRWVRPGGKPQERAFAFFPFLPLLGREGIGEPPEGLDVLDFRHRVIWRDSP